MLNKHEIYFSTWYVLVGFNTTFEEDLMRIGYLKDRKQTPYVMRHKNVNGKHEYIQLARWCNQPHIMRKQTYQEYIKGETYSLNLFCIFSLKTKL